MYRANLLLPFLLISVSLTSCSFAPQNLDEPIEFITPGDQIGDMTIEQSTTIPYRSISTFCEIIDEYEPFSTTTHCEVPAVSNLDIKIGWFATESKFESNWNSMSFLISIDERVINLDTFDWVETTFPQHGVDNIERMWTLTIKNLTPGKHTLVLSHTMDATVNDGFNTYQAGTYEQIINFTVQERADYLSLTTDAENGQNAYTSEDAQLEYLLYIPDEYGEDPQQEWPLIIYLHGAIWRGATPEMLLEESLPNKLEQEDDFRFIVLSPVGEGEFEFWSTDEMIYTLFALLEELQTKLAVDPSRIYLTGNDMGGNGVWEISLRYPNYFAALAPVTGYFSYPFSVPDNICDLKNVPIWAFHGKRDEEIPFDAGQQLVNALNACGGNAQITIIREMDIDIRFYVYHMDELYDWFLEHSLD